MIDEGESHGTTADATADLASDGATADATADLASDGTTAGVAGADGRRRRRTALAVIVAAVVAGGLGLWVGTLIESPADRAAVRAAPQASLITVAVEHRTLTSEIVLTGEVAYNEPVTVSLAGGVGIGPGETPVITEVREVGTDLQEGDVLVKVTGRPVFVLQGDLPMYRRMVVGTEGPDVRQLEEALVRLGYEVDEVDTVFDASTAAAVEQMYADSGNIAEGPSDEQRAELAAARDAVAGAERGVADARVALSDAQTPLPESERLQLELARDNAREAVPAAQAAAQSTRTEQDRFVANARAARDTAQTLRDAAVSVRDTARTPGAVDPDTDEPYTAERIAALEVAVAETQEALTQAESELVIAEQNRTAAVAAADAAIEDASAQLQIAEAQYSEATAGTNTSALQDAVGAAEQQLATAQAELAELEASAGTRISPGEIVFVPVLPSTLTANYVTLGSGIDGPIGMLATTDTLVRARVARADSGLVAVGADVEVEIRDAGVTTRGTVLSIGEPQGPNGEQPGFESPGGSSGSSGRLEVVVAPTGTELGRYMFYGARVRVEIASTDGDVLVVPVAALTVGPDETSQVEVVRTPATDDEPAQTEVVAVTVGLSANGLAEVAPVDDDALVDGDRVVIGVDTHLLQGSAPDVPAGDDDDDGADDGDEPSGERDADDTEEASPLAALMGWVSDPVEQRRQELAIQEAVADCMRAQGWQYEPVDWSAQMPQSDEEWGSRAFGERYGYSVMREYELNEGDMFGGGVMIDDPNDEYVAGLSESEQEQYWSDLYGGDSFVEAEFDDDGDEIWVPPPLEEQGCYGQARFEVVGEDPTADPDIQRVLSDFWSGQETDAGLQEIVRDWIACFQPTVDEHEIEFVLQSVHDGYQVMESLKFETMGLEVRHFSTEAEMNEFYSSGEDAIMGFGSENGGFVVIGPPDGNMPELTGEQIDELTAIEIELWTADRACQDEVGYEEYNRQREQAIVDRLVDQFPELGG